MSISRVSTVFIDEPVISFGRHFTGDYSQSQKYILEVQDILKKEGIEYTPFKVMGIFYDNPQEKPASDLRSFHAVFPLPGFQNAQTSLERFEVKGKFLQVNVKGDPSISIMEGYGILFKYIQENRIRLKSPAGYQVSTFENGEVSTEILMEI
jgi:hypothetical protein